MTRLTAGQPETWDQARATACRGARGAPMAERISTEVLIVGGGPVGLTSGMDLARRGVRWRSGGSLVERRNGRAYKARTTRVPAIMSCKACLRSVNPAMM